MMDKLISQQAAIDVIKKRLFETAFNNIGIKQDIDETLVDIAENRLENWFNELPSAQPEIVRCEDCRWGRKVCGNIECFVDSNIPTEYHGYEWFCPNGERRTDE